MRNVFNHLMIFLCTADILVILSAMAMSLQNLHPKLISVMEPLISYSDCVSHVSITASVFFTISITIERYIAVCSPLTYQVGYNVENKFPEGFFTPSSLLIK